MCVTFQNDLTASLDRMLQSLRLWNRAAESLTRLNPSPTTTAAEESNPFEMNSLQDALPTETPTPQASQSAHPIQKPFTRRPSMTGLEWRISEGLLSTLFSLSQAYFLRGSPREAEYFAQQAHDLAQSLNAPSMVSRALARKGEIQLHEGHLDAGHETLMQAAALLLDCPGTDAVDVRRLCGDYNQRKAQVKDAQQLYEEATSMLEELDKVFVTFDGLAFGSVRNYLLCCTDLMFCQASEISRYPCGQSSL